MTMATTTNSNNNISINKNPHQNHTNGLIIGLYGISGSGKSHTLQIIEKLRPEWYCLEGSQIVETILLENNDNNQTWQDFKQMNDTSKEEIRLNAIRRIQQQYQNHGITIVAGHFSFPNKASPSSSSSSSSPSSSSQKNSDNNDSTNDDDDDHNHCHDDGSKKKATTFKNVFTKGDGQVYDAILYLDKDPSIVLAQREQDTKTQKRIRDDDGLLLLNNVESIQAWIEHEKEGLKQACNQYGIPFIPITTNMMTNTGKGGNKGKYHDHDADADNDGEEEAKAIIDLICTTFVANLVQQAETKSNRALLDTVQHIPDADIFLMIDGDRTITPCDTGIMFFESVSMQTKKNICSGGGGGSGSNNNTTTSSSSPLKQIFTRYPEYSFQPFWEVSMLYNKVMSTSEYLQTSKDLGKSQVKFYKQWVSFLSKLASLSTTPSAMSTPSSTTTTSTTKRVVHSILISCSNREVWEAALEEHSLSDSVTVIAGNHSSLHDYIVDGTAKGLVANELRRLYSGCRIISFGDSELDIPMMKASDRAYVVVDHPRHNRSMSTFLKESAGSSRLYQIIDLALDDETQKEGKQEQKSPLPLLSLLFWHDGIRVGSLTSLEKEIGNGSIFGVVKTPYSKCMTASANLSAQQLATQTRRADLTGPLLQAVHEQVGMYLADCILEDFPLHDLFVRPCSFPHVQGTEFIANCIGGNVHANISRNSSSSNNSTPPTKDNNNNIVILPLMRAGDPMARGVYQRFPTAEYIHYHDRDSTPLKFLHSKERNGCNVNGSVENKTPLLVIVVDSVINRGNTIRGVLNHLFEEESSSSLSSMNNTDDNECHHHVLKPQPRQPQQRQPIFVYVLSGVMQKKASEDLPKEYPRVRFYTLRVSDNQYTGKGGTDTGNRLFSTF